jgi:hypothetical protein
MKSSLLFLMPFALLALACKSESKPAPTASSGSAAPNASAAPAASGPVKECEDYAAKMQACFPKMSPEDRAEQEPAFNAAREAWAGQTDRAALAKDCKAALATIPSACK